jgi:hypothetical protein
MFAKTSFDKDSAAGVHVYGEAVRDRIYRIMTGPDFGCVHHVPI